MGPGFRRGSMVTSRRMSTVHGWGATLAVAAEVIEPADRAEVGAAILGGPAAGSVPRGLGRSYGDAAQRANGLVVASTRLRDPPRVEANDERTAATLTAGSGWSLRELLVELVPAGWFLPVVPGTADITLGGAIAADVHGKNHHRDGSFGAHVDRLDLVTSDGECHQLRPNGASADAFWATIGGMGLTGMIVRATVRLARVPGPKLAVTTTRTPDLDVTMAALIEADRRHAHTVAWLDLATPQRRGRGVMQVADHVDDASHANESKPVRARPSVPALGLNLVRPGVTRAFNSAWWRRAPATPATEISSHGSFLHPLDSLVGWNRVYGTRGFVQWQMAVPVAATACVETCTARLSAHAIPPSLVVLKRFGESNPAPMSFPIPGWTLAVDVPAGHERTARLLDELDELVAEVGGRIYLAKDSRCRPEVLAAMYPRLSEWQAVRDHLDPRNAMASDLSRRLRL